MALNASVLRQYQPIRVPNPVETVLTGLDLRNRVLGNKSKELEVADAQKKQQQGEAIHQALIETGGDIEKALPKIAQIAPELLPHYQDFVTQQKQGRINNAVTARKAALENIAQAQGTPAEEVQAGPQGTQTPPSQIPDGGTVAPIQSPIPAGFAKELPMESTTIPGIEDLGIPAVTKRPTSLQELFRRDTAKLESQKKIEREANTYTITDPTTGKTITAPKDIIDNILTQSGENARKAPPKQTIEERTVDQWLKDNPGKTLNDYQNMDANRKRPVTNINTTAPGNFDKTGDEFLATIPAQWRATVKKIAHYEEDATKVASMRGGMREQLMQWVNQVNPAYNSVLFGNLAPARKAFTLGTQGQQINAINTAIGHIDQITSLGAKLDNGNVVKGNEFWNWAKTAFGADAVTSFDTLKDALAGEVASVLSKGGATVSGIADAKGKIHAASSPAQLAGYVKTLIPVMGSKLNALDYEYQQATGGNDPTFSALSPEAKSILRKNGIDPENPLGGSRKPDPMGIR